MRRGCFAEFSKLTMSILANKKTRLIVQGITGREGDFHARQMQAYSPIIVGGVTPGKGGMTTDYGVPVFDTVGEAVRKTGADASVIYVPAKFAPDAIMEAADAGVKFVTCITEGLAVIDMIRVRAYLDIKGVTLLGPNCPGMLTPGEAKIGIIPAMLARPGRVGVVSRSGTLTYEAMNSVSLSGLGQSSIVGIGGDPVHGLDFLDVIRMFNEDDATDMIVMLGEIGGSDEENACEYIAKNVRKPMAGFIAGRSAPPGRRMGHAGAIIEGNKGTAEGKESAMRAAGVHVATLVTEIPDLLMKAAKGRKVVAIKKVVSKKVAIKKVAAKKAIAKKVIAKKVVAKKVVAKKPVTKKVVAKKPVAKKMIKKSGKR